MPRTILSSERDIYHARRFSSRWAVQIVPPIEEKKVSGSRCCIFTTKSPFYHQNTTYTMLGVFRVDGLYLRYCPLRRKRLAETDVVFFTAENFIVRMRHIQRSPYKNSEGLYLSYRPLLFFRVAAGYAALSR